jgi:phosphoglycolate phosphatase-like HAD superfamily hydrolase
VDLRYELRLFVRYDTEGRYAIGVRNNVTRKIRRLPDATMAHRVQQVLPCCREVLHAGDRARVAYHDRELHLLATVITADFQGRRHYNWRMEHHPPLLIALDADGVLVDYNRTFGRIWELHFGDSLTELEPRAYHVHNRYGITAPPGGHPFWDHFDRDGWSNMDAMPGAVVACQRLAAAGYRLVCVTSMPGHRREDRASNLARLGFPIDEVIAVGAHTKAPAWPGGDRSVRSNPKKAAIEELAPEWFIDDDLHKLKDLPDTVGTVLLDPGYPDNPSHGQPDHFLRARVHDLGEFAELVLACR